MPGQPIGRPAGSVEVVRLSPNDDDAYEAFVRSHPQALLYHSLRFRDFLVELLGCEPTYAVALADGRVQGVLPLMSAIGRYGRVLNSLPYFGSNGGILASGRAARWALAAWYDAASAADDVAAATVVGNPLDTDPAVLRHDLSDVRVGCMTVLAGGGDPEETVLAAVDGSARRNVAKAARGGVNVEVDNEAFDALEQMHRFGMDAIGGRAKAPAFFHAVRRCFRVGVDYDLYVARIGDDIVAALLVFYYASTAEYYIPATRPDSRSEQPMAAILHRAMADAIRRGLTLWNWGGSWIDQENLIRFKTKWGGHPQQYQYLTRINNSDLLSTAPHELLECYPGFFVAPFSSLQCSRDVVR